jgi:copper(I)-binding protein
MLHKSESSGGMSQMNDVSTVDVAPHGTLSFSPGGYHLMCMDAKPELKAGGKVQVTLQFADGTVLSSEFAVRNAAGR